MDASVRNGRARGISLRPVAANVSALNDRVVLEEPSQNRIIGTVLEPETRLGPYVVESPLGAGGMGNVYRARDTRLDRTVALKILAPHVAADPALRDRLHHEARAISRLNHPHICALYDVGDAELAPGQSVHFLVLELIEGESLADLIARGPLPFDRALAYAVQIADAVSAAHRAGVVHGDLKPANIMISPAGVKLLDFGVARAVAAPGASGWTDGTTGTQALAAGAVVGTLHYLSPEQLEGREPDVRTDVHACGAVVYEMLTGRRTFDGDSAAAVIAAIVRHIPPPVSSVVPGAPSALDHVVATCLAKNPDERWQHAGDLMRELKWIAAGGGAASIAPARRSRATLFAAAAAALALAAVLAAVSVFTRGSGATSPVARTSILLPEGLRFPVPGALGGVGRFAISPDGTQLVVVAIDRSGTQQLWLRPLASLTASPIPGTEGASSPFWSPDSRRIAFIAQGQLKVIDVQAGGAPVVVTAPAFNTTGAWSRDDSIYFNPSASSPLHRVPASGGTATAVTTLDREAGEILHRNPILLPTGRHLLYTSVVQRTGEATGARGIFSARLDGGEPARQLIPGGTSVRIADGHIIFLRDNALVAQPFDAEAVALSGSARPIVERVELVGPASAAFSVSDTGMLAYVAAGDGSRLVWLDREGREVGTATQEAAAYGDLEMSPDGQRAVVSVADSSLNTRDLWIIELDRGVRTRLTFDRAEDVAPVWSPDGTRVLFASNRRGRYEIYEKPASGVVPEQLVHGGRGEKYPMSWARDGHSALYWEFDGDGTRLSTLPLSGEQDPQVFLSRVSQGRLSPDGNWVVYDSAESGRSEVYVVPYPNPTRRWQVSAAGGSLSRWRADGREIFYAARDNRLMAASVEVRDGELIIGNAVPLFEARPVGPRAFYAPAPDGQRFLVNLPAGDSTPTITLLQNWSQALAP